MNDEQYVLMTYGEYSSYGVAGVLVGPASPSVKALADEFYRDVLPQRVVVRVRVGWTPYEEQVRDVETARKRLIAEGLPLVDEPNHYGYDDTAYSDGSGLLQAWLIHRHGFREVEYIECHEGQVGEDL